MQLERQLMGDESLEPEVSFALLEMLRVRPEFAIVQLLYMEQGINMTQLASLTACSSSAASQQNKRSQPETWAFALLFR